MECISEFLGRRVKLFDRSTGLGHNGTLKNILETKKGFIVIIDSMLHYYPETENFSIMLLQPEDYA